MRQAEGISNLIIQLRGENVLLDFDLAELYKIETKAFLRIVQVNFAWFPDVFMFRLNEAEWNEVRQKRNLMQSGKTRKSQKVLAFTELGVSMLSFIIQSDVAVAMNKEIIQTFIRFKKYMNNRSEKEEEDLNEILPFLKNDDGQAFGVFNAIDELIKEGEKI